VWNHYIVEWRQVSVCHAVPQINPNPKVLAQAKMFISGKCPSDQLPHVERLVGTVDLDRYTQFIRLAPLLAAALKDGDAECVPSGYKQQGEGFGPEGRGWIIPNPQCRKTRSASVDELSLPLLLDSTERYVTEGSDLAFKVTYAIG